MVMLRRYQLSDGTWTNIYLLDGVQPSESRFGMVCFPGAPQLPEVIAFTDSWTDDTLGPAHYIFFPQSIGSQVVTMGDLIWSNVCDCADPYDPDCPCQFRRIHWMPSAADIQLTLEADGSNRISQFSLAIGRYELTIPHLSRLVIVDRGFLFDSSATGRSSNFGVAQGRKVDASESEILLEIADTRGRGVSRFVFPFELSGRGSGGSGSPTDFDALDIGLRFFRTLGDASGTSLRFSVFQAVDDRSRATCTGYFDRFHFAKPISPGAEDSYIEWSATTRLGSHYRTTAGCELILAPMASGGRAPRLVFTPLRIAALPQPVGSDSVYLCPSGDYQVAEVRHADGSATSMARHRVACGKSGIEELTFNIGQILRFEPYHNAYFDVVNDRPSTGPSTPYLTPDAETSWARLLPSSPLEKSLYLAQPDDAPLYSPNPTDIYPNSAPPVRTTGLDILQYQLIPLRAIDRDEQTLPLAPADGFRPSVGRGNRVSLSQRSSDREGLFRAALSSGRLTTFDSLELIWSELGGTVTQRRVAVTLVTISGNAQQVSIRLPEDFDQPLPPVGTPINYRIAPASHYLNLEGKVLEPERRRILFAGSPPPPGPVTFTDAWQDTVTPQGLLVQANVSQNFRFEVLKLGKSQPLVNSDDGEFIEFSNVWQSDPFSEGLRRNQLFAVLSGVPSNVGFDRNILNILGWIFTLKLDQTLPDTAPRPLLILKYYDGKSLADLVEDRSVWAGGLFQDRDQDTLREFVRDVRSRRLTDPKHYGGIHRKIEDPNWSGVLAINIALDCNSLPGPLKGLAIGLQLDQFRAHHVGVNASRYEPGPDGLTVGIRKSSLFGLIDYRPPSPIAAGGGGGAFEFTLTKLQVLFEQSAIRGFAAEVQFATKQPFKQRSNGDDKVVVKGSYEQKNGVDTYTFVCANRKDIVLENIASGARPFIETLSIYRVEMVTEAGSGSGLIPVTARFSVTGAVGLGETFENYLCLTDAAFQNMTAEFKFDIDSNGRTQNFQRPSFNPGLLSFDLSKAQTCARSLLSVLPLKLKRFYFSPANARVDLLDLGFLPLTRRGYTPPNPGPGDIDGNLFDYALSFALDLGSLGALAQPLKDFKAEVLLGWSVLNESRIAGIRFPEGRMRLGIQGVLELIIERFAMQWVQRTSPSVDPYYAIALDNCQIKVLGCSFPPNDNELDIFLFPNPSAPLSSRVGWFGGYAFDSNDFVGVGQRLAIRPASSRPATCDDVIQKLRGWASVLGNRPTEEGFRELSYSKDNEWTAALDVEILSGVRLAVVFNDPHLYALRLSVQPPGFAIDVVYRKITDDLGVYSTQVRLPDAVRQIEMGAASLTLPIVGLDIYTNGDFRVDLGFPWNVDFRRSFALQILPFIGKGGIYVGRLNGVTSNLLQDRTLTKIAVFGLGISVGLGKEFEKGIFRFGVSVSLYGILEGALGYHENNSDLFKPDAYCLLGRVGILAQLFGTVDFGVLKVSVTIVIEVGLPFRIRKQNGDFNFTVPGIEANVSVTAEVVVGSMRIFGKRIEITVSYSFEMHLRLRFPIGGDPEAFAISGTAAQRLTEAAQLRWTESQFDNLYQVLNA